jgi:hypothetical protein
MCFAFHEKDKSHQFTIIFGWIFPHQVSFGAALQTFAPRLRLPTESPTASARAGRWGDRQGSSVATD